MKDIFIQLIKNATSVVIPNFDKQYRYNLLRYEKFYSLYYYSKGSKWNLGGNHYYYIFGLDGNFEQSVNSVTGGKPIERIRLLKADILALQVYRKIKI